MKKIITSLLLIAMLLLSFTACSFDFNLKDTSGDSNKNEQTGGDENGQETENGNQQTPPIEEKDPIESFSPILQTVLKSEYYKELVKQAKIDIQFKDYSHQTSNRYQAIPYGFLEDEGYNIEAIKNNEIKCESDVFVLDGDLYIACRVENKASTPYYTHYVIRYELTEQELSDLNLTHYRLNSEFSVEREICFQAPLFIQELSLVKNAEKLSEAHMVKSAEEGVENNIETRVSSDNKVDMSSFGNNVSVTYLGHWIESGKIVSSSYLIFNNYVKSSSAIQRKSLAQITFSGYFSGDTSTIENDNYVRTGPSGTYINEEYKQEFENSKRKATFYNSYDSNFVDMLSPDYDQFYGLEK